MNLSFSNMEELNTAYGLMSIRINENFNINGKEYTVFDSTTTKVEHVLSENKQLNAVIFNRVDNAGAAVAILYETNNGKLIPTHANYINLKPFLTVNESKERNVIGDFVNIRFTSLPSSTYIKGKVDTGATISCLHVDDYSITESQVSFRCSFLSDSVLTMPLSDIQTVKSADSTNYRPVIELDIKIGDQILQKVKFNLNNRSNMDSPILVGQNILEAGKFLIDPTVKENVSISWPDLKVYLMEMEADGRHNGEDIIPTTNDFDGETDNDTKDEMVSKLNDDIKEISDVYKLLRGSNIKLADLMEFARNYDGD